MNKLRNIWVGVSKWFNKLPKPLKAIFWNLLSVSSTNIAAYFSGEFSASELKVLLGVTVFGSLASFFSYLASYFGSKKEVV